jgi:hypothetical protein
MGLRIVLLTLLQDSSMVVDGKKFSSSQHGYEMVAIIASV